MYAYEREFPTDFLRQSQAVADLVSWARGAADLDYHTVGAAGWNVLGFWLNYLPRHAAADIHAAADTADLASAALSPADLADRLEPLATTIALQGAAPTPAANWELIKPYLPFIKEILKRWAVGVIDRIGNN